MALAACVDPPGRFDDFAGRVIDADTNRIDGGGNLSDITGEFLFSIQPSFAPDAILRFIATVEFQASGDGAVADFSFQPIKVERCPPAGDGGTPVGEPLPASQIPISASGSFTVSLEDAVVTEQANDVSCSDITADIELLASIRSADVFCGDVEGMVSRPVQIALAGSTFGAVRIPAGTTGDADLPEPLTACPVVSPPDAGPIDGGLPDAGLDAGPDAAL